MFVCRARAGIYQGRGCTPNEKVIRNADANEKPMSVPIPICKMPKPMPMPIRMLILCHCCRKRSSPKTTKVDTEGFLRMEDRQAVCRGEVQQIPRSLEVHNAPCSSKFGSRIETVVGQ